MLLSYHYWCYAKLGFTFHLRRVCHTFLYVSRGVRNISSLAINWLFYSFKTFHHCISVQNPLTLRLLIL